MRATLENNDVWNNVIQQGWKFRVGNLTLGAGLTMDRDMAPVLNLDPGGATRIILLPPEEEGLAFIIVNNADAAEDLTVKEDAGVTTIGTISQSECALLVCAGGVWRIGVGTTT